MLVVAPGGAGAGASTECCSHGGPGGGGHGSVAILAQDSHHENLDTGFSPGANYSELAGVGTGANGTFTPGQAGHRGSYQVFNSIVRSFLLLLALQRVNISISEYEAMHMKL